MKIDQTQKNIPKEWKISKASFCIDVRDGTHATPKPTEIGVPLITSKNIINGELNLFDSYNVSNNDAQEINKRSKVNSGDILVSMIGTVGEAAIIKNEPNFVVKNVGIFKTGSKVILPTFLILQFHSVYLQNKIKSLSSGGIQKFISLGQLRKLPILLPPIPEQNRIVAVLETWDGATEKLAKKIEIKKEVKKGLMQELLTGKTRLPGFSDEWKKVVIGELGEYYSGLTGKNKEDFGSGKPYISYMNIYLNSKINTDIKDFVKIADSEGQNTVKYGDLFFTTSSETPDEVGIASVMLEKNIGEVYLNSFCFGFRLFSFEKLIPEFAQFYFRSRSFRKSMFEIAQGASRFNLSKKYFVQIEIKIPKNIAEQIAIANILTTTDKEIKGLQQKLTLLKDQKKYLLNNLITGIIRTPETLSVSTPLNRANSPQLEIASIDNS